MSKHHPECPLYNHNNCRELDNPKLCAIVRKDKVCLRKQQRKAHAEFTETVKRIKDQKPKLEALVAADNKRTGTIKDIGKYVYWKHEGLWVGYFKGYPEHWSQGETVAELKEGLLKVYETLR
jgi:hypothetical protein